MSASKLETWISAGYELLGREGMEGMRIERLARSLHLNKSGFYYYFGGMGLFLKRLIRHHVERAQIVGEEMANCKNLDPDLLLLVVKHREFFLVESQLLVKSRLARFDEDVDEAGKIISRGLLPLWRKGRTQTEDAASSLAYLNIIRHFVYSRINPENINYPFLHKLADETVSALGNVVAGNRVSSGSTGTPEHPS